MESLIPLVNDLQDIFNGLGFTPIELPQICTVGGQSAGKSSVLESIVGKDFLPRGSGICTRRPLLLQLINPHKKEWEESIDEGTGEPIWVNAITGEKVSEEPPAPDSDFKEYGEFLHKPGEKFYDFNEIRTEIERYTEETCPNKNVSADPIRLKIVSADVLTMTLVDLPGLTLNPVGDQSETIVQDIKEMVANFVKNENCIILAVSPAINDIANSESLAIARKFDPLGERTVGVLTKLDMMDQGTDALNMLEGKEYPLKLGYVGVVNRNQKAINESVAMKVAHTEERKFFESHPAYMHMASRMGTSYLAKTLNKVLVNHIKDKLPGIRTKITSMAAQKEDELMALGGDVDLTPDEKKRSLLHTLTKVAQEYRNSLDGLSDNIATDELYGGARIGYIFRKNFSEELTKMMHTGEANLESDIRYILKNVQGIGNTLFPPMRAFEILVQRSVERLHRPCKNCAQLVHDELSRLILDLPCEELKRFGRLRERVVQVTSVMLRNCLTDTRKLVSDMLEMESAYPNMDHPDFVTAAAKAQRQLHGEDNDPIMDGGSSTNFVSKEQEEYRTKKLIAVFNFLDKDGNGEVDIEEIKKWGEDLRGKPYTAEEVEKILKSFDADDNKRITLQEWLNYHKSVIPGNYTVEQFDESLQNYLPQKTLNKIADRLPAMLRVDAERSEHQVKQTVLIQRLLKEYNSIVLKNVQDAIPKAIMLKMVNKSKELVQDELLMKLYDGPSQNPEMVEELLEEQPELEAARKRCKQMVNVLNKALEVLNTVNDKAV